jgi:polyferredoxin
VSVVHGSSHRVTLRLGIRHKNLARLIEQFVLQHPRGFGWLQVGMIVLYLALIVIPPFLPEPSASATALTSFVRFSQFVIWCVWWPGVVLSMLFFGRLWCGILCPEGALAARVSRYGANRAIPGWMRWGAVPLLGFVTLTVLGQVFEVDEEPLAQLAILGGSTLLAIAVAFIYRRRAWVWCRFLCPVSLLFGVFSRLGAMHFAVDRQRLALTTGGREQGQCKNPCPVMTHLPVMATNRYCVMCFRCAGWRDAIHLQFRSPGEELSRISQAEPLIWEVMFLFGGAVGLPLGVFLGECLDWHGIRLVSLLLGATVSGIGVLSALTWLATRRAAGPFDGVSAKERFTRLGYVYTPLSLFSLVLGLTQPTFEELNRFGFPSAIATSIRISLLVIGSLWSVVLVWKMTGVSRRTMQRVAHAVPLLIGIAIIMIGWIAVAVMGS